MSTPSAGHLHFTLVIFACYGLASLAICVHGLHRCWLTWHFLSDIRRMCLGRSPILRLDTLPQVTIQLPMFNEAPVAQRVIEAACQVDYPADRLQIQVLDDSTDESAHIVRECCERLQADGHPIQLLHRHDRHGYKGGALSDAMALATGELVAIFDADFLPPPAFLRRTIHFFADPTVGMVQTRWSHLNRYQSLLTECQAMFLDGHFVVEQATRSSTGHWFNFNGTAGIWRKTCINDAGGWQHDTLTEDTDLSYRAQLAGWRFIYLPTVRCDSQLPCTMTAFVSQQYRWSKGLIQTAIKLLPRVMQSSAPWATKCEAWLHLTCPIMYMVMFVVAVLALPALCGVSRHFTHELTFALGLATFVLGTLGASFFYVVSQHAQGRSLVGTLVRLPFLMALGIGLSAVNTRAVIEALLGIRSPFIRTPKWGKDGSSTLDLAVTRNTLRAPAGLVELLIAGCLVVAIPLSVLRPITTIGTPFLFLFAVGYIWVGAMRAVEQCRVCHYSRHVVAHVGKYSDTDAGTQNAITEDIVGSDNHRVLDISRID